MARLRTTRTQQEVNTRILNVRQKRGEQQPQIPHDLEYLHFKQDSSIPADFPADGTDFSLTHLINRHLLFHNVSVFFNAGTFSVRLKIGGVLVGPTLTQATAGLSTGIVIDPALVYKDNQAITLHVNSSGADVEQFESIFTFIEV